MQAFKIVWKAAVAFYDEMFNFLLMGTVTLIGCFLIIPGLYLAIIWQFGIVPVILIGIVLILPGPFVIAGLYAAGQKAVRGEGIKWSTYWQGMKEFGLRSWLLLLIILAVYGLLYTNFWFYSTSGISPFSEQVGFWLTPLWIGLAVIWTGIAYYAQAFLMELEEPKIIAIFRSSLFLTILRPIATLILVGVSLLVLVLSVALPILLILTPSFLFVLALTAVRTQITQLIDKTKEEEEKNQSAENAETNDNNHQQPAVEPET